MNPALFLDRDGVINEDYGYVFKSKDFKFIDGIFDLCRYAKQNNFLICVVTNQAGIGRGFYTEEDFWHLTNWMCEVFKVEGIFIDKVYFCPTHLTHGIGKYKVDSIDRKPAPGMIIQAIKELNIDQSRSVLIGDKESDIQAGIAAGIAYNLLYHPTGLNRQISSTVTTVITKLGDALPFFYIPTSIHSCI